jgi:hypothetical protein
MAAFVCHAYQLLPGGPCPEYAYRYRFLGQCLPETFGEGELGTAFWALLARTRAAPEDENERERLAGWLASTRAQWQHSRFTGWEPRSGLAFRFERLQDSPAPGHHWQWVVIQPRVRRRG